MAQLKQQQVPQKLDEAWRRKTTTNDRVIFATETKLSIFHLSADNGFGPYWFARSYWLWYVVLLMHCIGATPFGHGDNCPEGILSASQLLCLVHQCRVRSIKVCWVFVYLLRVLVCFASKFPSSSYLRTGSCSDSTHNLPCQWCHP